MFMKAILRKQRGVMAAAAILVVLVSWMGATRWSREPAARAEPVDNVLLVSSRDSLVVCVAPLVEGSQAAGVGVAAAQTVLDGLSASQSEEWVDAAGATEVTGECSRRVSVMPGLDGNYAIADEPPVEEPSPERLFVVLVPDDLLAQTIGKGLRGDSAFAQAAIEMMCSDDNCFEVTTAVYVGESSAKDTSGGALVDAMSWGLGIRPLVDPLFPSGHADDVEFEQ